MGHRLSKTPANGCNATTLNQQHQPQQQQEHHHQQQQHNNCSSLQRNRSVAPTATTPTTAKSRPIPIGAGPTFNLQIQDAPTITTTNKAQTHHTQHNSYHHHEEQQLLSPPSRQIIIKIQLAKMEPGSERQQEQQVNDSSLAVANNNGGGAQFLNLTFNRSVNCDELATPSTTSAALLCPNGSIDRQQQRLLSQRTAGGSLNNHFAQNGDRENFNILMAPMSDLQLTTTTPSGGSDLTETPLDVTENRATTDKSLCEDVADVDGEYCCRRKNKNTAFPSKWRCCKCTCLDAIKRIKDASSSKSSSKKKERQKSTQQQHSIERPQLAVVSTAISPAQRCSNNNNSVPATPSTFVTPTNSGNDVQGAPAHMSIWAPSTNDVFISSPQFVVVQCPPSSLVTLGRIDDNSIRLMATELVAANSSSSTASLATPHHVLTTTADMSPVMQMPPAMSTPCSSSTPTSSVATPKLCAAAVVAAGGPVVHSQVDYIHCLVPDLERITKASFYWGKMDRYEAERLLEGKPEGTFLLRDSAQEEYLFSVTFRKYGRSLHARIEQSNHKFSFDCHDPCVFTASTVTGLLEHYKDPACVMFFEPMLTIPLHRKTSFSLQQLCRATIVSQTTYDGINELELPSRLKSYLKEYHYKQKLRVKPFDEPFYACT